MITCFASSSLIHTLAGPLSPRGICLAADTLKGVAFGFRCKCPCSDFIGARVDSSLNTLGNCLSMSSLNNVSTERADGLGKVL